MGRPPFSPHDGEWNWNEFGNWEMLLPFRSENVVMPNNRSQALSRLNGLLSSLKRKPQMQKDYLAFIAKIFELGHATAVIQEEPSQRNIDDEQEKTSTSSRSRGVPGSVAKQRVIN